MKKQDYLPADGMEPARDEQIDALAEVYYERTCERSALSKEEGEAHAALLDMLETKELEVYRWEAPTGTFVLRRTVGKPKVKFDRVKGEDE